MNIKCEFKLSKPHFIAVLALSLTLNQFASPLLIQVSPFAKCEGLGPYEQSGRTGSDSIHFGEMENLIKADNNYNQALPHTLGENFLVFLSETRKASD